LQQKVLIVRSLNETPEEEVTSRTQELGPEWRITSASTAIALQGEMDVDGPDVGRFYGVAKHVYFVATIVLEKL
jgi:hypothetical protein